MGNKYIGLGSVRTPVGRMKVNVHLPFIHVHIFISSFSVNKLFPFTLCEVLQGVEIFIFDLFCDDIFFTLQPASAGRSEKTASLP